MASLGLNDDVGGAVGVVLVDDDGSLVMPKAAAVSSFSTDAAA